MWREGEGKRGRGRNQRFRRSFSAPDGRLRGMTERIHRLGPVRPGRFQELGTIEVGSKVEITASWKESRSRWNSIRRSNALERMMGKRVMTFSRTVRKSDASNDTFGKKPGNERGSAMASLMKTRR